MTRVTRRQRWHTTALLACSLVVITGRAGAQDAALTPAQFISELGRLIGRIESAGPSTAELARVAGEMPSRWRVEAGDRTVLDSRRAAGWRSARSGSERDRPLRTLCTSWTRCGRTGRRRSCSSAAGFPMPAQRVRGLEEILSAREFRAGGSRPPACR